MPQIYFTFCDGAKTWLNQPICTTHTNNIANKHNKTKSIGNLSQLVLLLPQLHAHVIQTISCICLNQTCL